MLIALRDAFSGVSDQVHQSTINTTVEDAVKVNRWGTDYHLFALSLLLDRPIFHYNTVSDHSLPAASTVEQFAQCFHSRGAGTRVHCIYCTSVHKALLSDGRISNLRLPPISLFNKQNVHWVAMLPVSQSAMEHMPIPPQRILAD